MKSLFPGWGHWGHFLWVFRLVEQKAKATQDKARDKTCTRVGWDIKRKVWQYLTEPYRNISKRKLVDLRSSVTASCLTPSTRTRCSYTTWVLCNTRRSGLLLCATTLARTPRVPRPHAVNITALYKAWNRVIPIWSTPSTTAARVRY